MADVAGSQQSASSVRALWALLSFLTRARASAGALQPDTRFHVRGSRGDWLRLPIRGRCADPGLSPTSQLAVTAERSVKDPNGRALSPRCRRPRITHRSAASSRLSIRLSRILPQPGIPHHALSGRRFGAMAYAPQLARALKARPTRGRSGPASREANLTMKGPILSRFRSASSPTETPTDEPPALAPSSLAEHEAATQRLPL